MPHLRSGRAVAAFVIIASAVAACAPAAAPRTDAREVVAEVTAQVFPAQRHVEFVIHDPGAETVTALPLREVDLSPLPPGAGTPQQSGQGLPQVALGERAEDKNGVAGTAAQAERMELIVECNGVPGTVCAAPFSPPQNVVDGCGPGRDSLEFDVTLRSFFTAPLVDVHIEIDSVTPPAGAPAANFSLCLDDHGGDNRSVDSAPLDSTLGLYRYGHLAADDNGPLAAGPAAAADTVRWRFQTDGRPFSFHGRIIAGLCSDDDNCAPLMPLPDAWQVEGGAASDVNALIEGDGIVYLGGDFSSAGARSGALATVDSAGAGVALWPAVEGGDVTALVADGAGGVFLGGTFTRIGDVARAGLAHVWSDGSIDDAFEAPAPNGAVNVLRVVGVNLFVGGAFTLLGSSSALRLASLSTTTGALNGFVGGANGEVFAVEASGANLYVGGSFSTIGGQSRPRLARVSQSTGNADSFAPRVDDGTVYAVAVDAARGRVVAGGSFTTARDQGLPGLPQLRRRLVSFATSNAALSTWNPDVDDGAVFSVQASGDALYVAGSFTAISTARSHVGAVSLVDTGTQLAFNPNANDAVHVLLVDGARVYLAGAFSTVGGSSRVRLAAADATTGALVAAFAPALGAGTAAATRTLAKVGARLAVAGGVRSVDVVRRENAAALDTVTGAATAFTPALAAADVVRAGLYDATLHHVILGGDGFLGAYHGDSGAQVWRVAHNGAVHAVAKDAAGLVYVGGNFSVFGGSLRGNTAAVTSSAGALQPWTFATLGTVRAVAVHQTLCEGAAAEVYLGGDGLLGALANGVAAMPLGPALPLLRQSWLVGGGTVSALVPWRDRLLVGGSFTTVDLQARARLAALKRGTLSAAPLFDLDGPVAALSASGTTLHLTGGFHSGGGGACVGLCLLHGEGPLLPHDGQVDAGARAVLVVGAQLWTGGAFVDDTVHGGSARTGVMVSWAD